MELVPIGSFLFQRGRCRYCGGPIGLCHLGIELAALALALSAAYVEKGQAVLWADCVLGWTLLTLGWIDWTHLRLPDVLTLPLLLEGLAVTAVLEPNEVTDHAVAAALGYAALWLIALAYKALRSRDGLGEGDAKMLAAAGAWVGLEGLGPVILVAACVGFAVAAIRRGRLTQHSVIPFGTCLALGTWLMRLLR